MTGHLLLTWLAVWTAACTLIAVQRTRVAHHRIARAQREADEYNQLVRAGLRLLRDNEAQRCRSRLVHMTHQVRCSLATGDPVVMRRDVEAEIDVTCARLVDLSLTAWQGRDIYEEEPRS